MLKGGYQIINFSDDIIELNSPFMSDKIYSKLAQTNKPILISGLIIDGNIFRDTFTQINLVNGNYIVNNFYGYDITIEPNNNVIITNHKNESGISPEIIDIVYDENEPIQRYFKGIYNIANNYQNNPLILARYVDGDGAYTGMTSICTNYVLGENEGDIVLTFDHHIGQYSIIIKPDDTYSKPE